MTSTTASRDISGILLYCRAGFEKECCDELSGILDALTGIVFELAAETGSGFVLATFRQPSDLSRLARVRLEHLIFARQLLFVFAQLTELPDRDRLTPVAGLLQAAGRRFRDLQLETPDTNDGKTLSAFCRRFTPLLASTMAAAGLLAESDETAPRLHVFFPAQQRCLLALGLPGNCCDWPMGVPRLRMPGDAPSRSTLKLAEAFMVLLTPEQRDTLLRPGLNAVDLGAAPGGWTWQLASRGIRVTAVDNGPLKGSVAQDPLVQHLRVDGFKYRPRRPVDWLVCDMVEQPAKVTQLISQWLCQGWARNVLFNLKLPMKKRLQEVNKCLALLAEQLHVAGFRSQIRARQLYHDREEVTVLVTTSQHKRRSVP